MLSGSHKGDSTDLDGIPPKTVGSPAIHPHTTLVSASVNWGKLAHYGF